MNSESNWRTERDSDGFPICNEDRNGQTFTDEYEVTYTCTLIEGLGWVCKNNDAPPE